MTRDREKGKDVGRKTEREKLRGGRRQNEK